MIAKLHLCKIAKLHDDFKLNVGLASFDGLDDCSLSAAAGYEIELGIGKEVLELSAWLPKNLYISDVLSGELVGILSALG